MPGEILNAEIIEAIQKVASKCHVDPLPTNEEIERAYKTFHKQIFPLVFNQGRGSTEEKDKAIGAFFQDLVSSLYENALPFYPSMVRLSEKANYKMKLEALRDMNDESLNEIHAKYLEKAKNYGAIDSHVKTLEEMQELRKKLQAPGGVEATLEAMGYDKPGVERLERQNEECLHVSDLLSVLQFEETRIANLEKTRNSLRPHFESFGGIQAHGKPVFYSGDHFSAKEGASSNGHQLLANSVVEATANFIGSPEASTLQIGNSSWKRACMFWHTVSAEYASTAKPGDEIKVFVPAGLLNSSVFWDTELPELTKKCNITQIYTYSLSDKEAKRLSEEKSDYEAKIKSIETQVIEIDKKLKELDALLATAADPTNLKQEKQTLEEERKRLLVEKASVTKDYKDNLTQQLQDKSTWTVRSLLTSKIVPDAERRDFNLASVQKFALRWKEHTNPDRLRGALDASMDEELKPGEKYMGRKLTLTQEDMKKALAREREDSDAENQPPNPNIASPT